MPDSPDDLRKDRLVRARRLAQGMCADHSLQYLPITSTLISAWDESVTQSLPQNMLDLLAKLDAPPAIRE
jgi:hypothetical protein